MTLIDNLNRLDNSVGYKKLLMIMSLPVVFIMFTYYLGGIWQQKIQEALPYNVVYICMHVLFACVFLMFVGEYVKAKKGEIKP